ncbi:MAG: hypothetical protein ACRDRG_21790 [Pseudonocardiaceae bacterium]
MWLRTLGGPRPVCGPERSRAYPSPRPCLEQAAALGCDALRTATNLSSTITVERLRTLQRQVRPLRSASPHLTDLDDRLTGFLTHTTRRQHDDHAL